MNISHGIVAIFFTGLAFLACAPSLEQRRDQLQGAVLNPKCRSEEECSKHVSDAKQLMVECHNGHDSWRASERYRDCHDVEGLVEDAAFRLAEYRIESRSDACFKEKQADVCYELHKLALDQRPTVVSNGQLRQMRQEMTKKAFAFCSSACAHSKHVECCAYVNRLGEAAVAARAAAENRPWCLSGCQSALDSCLSTCGDDASSQIDIGCRRACASDAQRCVASCR